MNNIVIEQMSFGFVQESLDTIESKKDSIRRAKDRLESLMNQSEDWKKIKRESDALTERRKEIRAKMNQMPQIYATRQELTEMRAELDEQKTALSGKLLVVAQKHGSTIQLPNGTSYHIMRSAKLAAVKERK